MLNIQVEKLEDYLRKAYLAGWHGSLDLKENFVAETINEIKNQVGYGFSDTTIRIVPDNNTNNVFVDQPIYMNSVYSGNVDTSYNFQQQNFNFDTSNLSIQTEQ